MFDDIGKKYLTDPYASTDGRNLGTWSENPETTQGNYSLNGRTLESTAGRMGYTKLNPDTLQALQSMGWSGGDPFQITAASGNPEAGNDDPGGISLRPEFRAWMQQNGIQATSGADAGMGKASLSFAGPDGQPIGSPTQVDYGNNNLFMSALVAGLGGSVLSAGALGGGGLDATQAAAAASDAGGGSLGAGSGLEGLGGTFDVPYQAYNGPGAEGFQVAGDNAVAPAGWGSAAETGGGLSTADTAALYGPEGYGAGSELGTGSLNALGSGAGYTVPSGGSSGGWLSSLNDALGTKLTGGNLIGAGVNGLMSLYTSNKALNAQKDATNQANALLQPYRDLGTAGVTGYGNLLKDPNSITSDPGYKFQLDEGQRALDNKAAASGGYYSGAQLKATSKWNQDYASTALDAALKRYGNAAQLGATGTQATSNNVIGLGDAGAASSMYAGNGLTNALNGLIGQSTYKPPPGYALTPVNGLYKG